MTGGFWSQHWRSSLQVVHDPCPNLGKYHHALGVSSMIIPVDCLPDHILLLGQELLECLFAPSPVDVLGTSFMLVYLSSPAPWSLHNLATVTGPQGAWSMGSTIPSSFFMGGMGICGLPMGVIVIASPHFCLDKSVPTTTLLPIVPRST